MADRGDLFNFYQKDESFTFKQGLKIIAGAARGLAYMHLMPTPVVHRDIKSGNLMITSSGRGHEEVKGKVGDCGESRRVDLSATMTETGTPLWAAVGFSACYGRVDIILSGVSHRTTRISLFSLYSM